MAGLPKIKLDLKTLPVYAKAVIAVLPALIIAALVFFVLIAPKQKSIKTLDAKIDEQNNKIAEGQAKVAKLDVLKREFENLEKRLNELKEQLPEEKEITSLLKQLTDMSISSGLDIKSWRPRAKIDHSSGIVFETPSEIVAVGTYHDLGRFLSNLTRINRIVNITSLRLGGAKRSKDPANNNLDIIFALSAFSGKSEADAAKKPAGK
ncbi:MAG: type IV pilus inner membrane component PilO [Thermodesulfovibrionales bacterium]